MCFREGCKIEGRSLSFGDSFQSISPQTSPGRDFVNEADVFQKQLKACHVKTEHMSGIHRVAWTETLLTRD